MNIEDDAMTFVRLVRAQDAAGRLVIDEPAAERLIATALRVARDCGIIDGMKHMSAITDNALAKVA